MKLPHHRSKSTAPVISPCNSECVLNSHDICTGCFRTIEEITGWAQKSESEQRAIVENCAKRVRSASIA